MRDADRIRPGLVDGGMDLEAGQVDRLVADDDSAVMVDEQQVRDADMAEIHAERVDPEMVGPFRVAHGDVAGGAMVEAVMGEEAQAGGEAAFTEQADFLNAWPGFRQDPLRLGGGDRRRG